MGPKRTLIKKCPVIIIPEDKPKATSVQQTLPLLPKQLTSKENSEQPKIPKLEVNNGQGPKGLSELFISAEGSKADLHQLDVQNEKERIEQLVQDNIKALGLNSGNSGSPKRQEAQAPQPDARSDQLFYGWNNQNPQHQQHNLQLFINQLKTEFHQLKTENTVKEESPPPQVADAESEMAAQLTLHALKASDLVELFKKKIKTLLGADALNSWEKFKRVEDKPQTPQQLRFNQAELNLYKAVQTVENLQGNPIQSPVQAQVQMNTSSKVMYLVKTTKHQNLTETLYQPKKFEQQTRSFELAEDSDRENERERILRCMGLDKKVQERVSYFTSYASQNQEDLSQRLARFALLEDVRTIDLSLPLMVNGFLQSPYFIPILSSRIRSNVQHCFSQLPPIFSGVLGFQNDQEITEVCSALNKISLGIISIINYAPESQAEAQAFGWMTDQNSKRLSILFSLVRLFQHLTDACQTHYIVRKKKTSPYLPVPIKFRNARGAMDMHHQKKYILSFAHLEIVQEKIAQTFKEHYKNLPAWFKSMKESREYPFRQYIAGSSQCTNNETCHSYECTNLQSIQLSEFLQSLNESLELRDSFDNLDFGYSCTNAYLAACACQGHYLVKDPTTFKAMIALQIGRQSVELCHAKDTQFCTVVEYRDRGADAYKKKEEVVEKAKQEVTNQDQENKDDRRKLPGAVFEYHKNRIIKKVLGGVYLAPVFTFVPDMSSIKKSKLSFITFTEFVEEAFKQLNNVLHNGKRKLIIQIIFKANEKERPTIAQVQNWNSGAKIAQSVDYIQTHLSTDVQVVHGNIMMKDVLNKKNQKTGMAPAYRFHKRRSTISKSQQELHQACLGSDLNNARLGVIDGMQMGDSSYKHQNGFEQLISSAKCDTKGYMFSGHEQIQRDLFLYKNYTEVESIQVWTPVFDGRLTKHNLEAQVYNAACNLIVNNDEITHANVQAGFSLISQLARMTAVHENIYGTSVPNIPRQKFGVEDFRRLSSMVSARIIRQASQDYLKKKGRSKRVSELNDQAQASAYSEKQIIEQEKEALLIQLSFKNSIIEIVKVYCKHLQEKAGKRRSQNNSVEFFQQVEANNKELEKYLVKELNSIQNTQLVDVEIFKLHYGKYFVTPAEVIKGEQVFCSILPIMIRTFKHIKRRPPTNDNPQILVFEFRDYLDALYRLVESNALYCRLHCLPEIEAKTIIDYLATQPIVLLNLCLVLSVIPIYVPAEIRSQEEKEAFLDLNRDEFDTLFLDQACFHIKDKLTSLYSRCELLIKADQSKIPADVEAAELDLLQMYFVYGLQDSEWSKENVQQLMRRSADFRWLQQNNILEQISKEPGLVKPQLHHCLEHIERNTNCIAGTRRPDLGQDFRDKCFPAEKMEVDSNKPMPFHSQSPAKFQVQRYRILTETEAARYDQFVQQSAQLDLQKKSFYEIDLTMDDNNNSIGEANKVCQVLSARNQAPPSFDASDLLDAISKFKDLYAGNEAKFLDSIAKRVVNGAAFDEKEKLQIAHAYTQLQNFLHPNVNNKDKVAGLEVCASDEASELSAYKQNDSGKLIKVVKQSNQKSQDVLSEGKAMQNYNLAAGGVSGISGLNSDQKNDSLTKQIFIDKLHKALGQMDQDIFEAEESKVDGFKNFLVNQKASLSNFLDKEEKNPNDFDLNDVKNYFESFEKLMQFELQKESNRIDSALNQTQFAAQTDQNQNDALSQAQKSSQSDSKKSQTPNASNQANFTPKQPSQPNIEAVEEQLLEENVFNLKASSSGDSSHKTSQVTQVFDQHQEEFFKQDDDLIKLIEKIDEQQQKWDDTREAYAAKKLEIVSFTGKKNSKAYKELVQQGDTLKRKHMAAGMKRDKLGRKASARKLELIKELEELSENS